MHFKIKIWHLLILICLLIFIIRFSLIINTYILAFDFVYLLVTEFSKAAGQFSFSLIDSILSAFLIFIVTVLAFVKRRKSLLDKQINFTSSVITVLLIFFLLAPLVTAENPDFQKNLSVTKLLPPFSKVKVLHLKVNNTGNKSLFYYFLILKNEVVKRSFNEDIILADSIVTSRKILYYQGGIANEIPAGKLLIKNGRPVITTKYFLLGTDELGRDIFSRLVYGARISLFVGLGSVLISLVLGLSLGFLAGYPGGIIDSSLSRFTDMFLAFPVIFLIILILALFGNSLLSVMVVLGFSGWMSLFKIVRGEVISLKNKDFFICAKLIGLSKPQLLLREVLPVILAPITVNLVFQYGNVILAEAALSYLGLGTGSTYPSWGSMIEAGQNYLSQAWWMIFFPGLILFLTLYTANNLGKEINLYFNPRIEYGK